MRALREAAPSETEVVVGGPGVPAPFASAEGVRLTDDLAELAHATA